MLPGLLPHLSTAISIARVLDPRNGTISNKKVEQWLGNKAMLLHGVVEQSGQEHIRTGG